jgi:hypothetical protein
MSDHAIFFDPSRRRWWWIKRISTVLGLFSVVVVSIFLISVTATPLLPEMPGITSAIKRTLRRSVRLPRHGTQLQQFLLRKDRNKLLSAVAHDGAVARARAAKPLVQAPTIVAAFYAPWQETGLHSLRANAGQMTHLLPAWVHLKEDATGLDFHDWDPVLTPHNNDVLAIAHEHNLNVLPVLSNAQLSDFDPKRVHIFLNSPALQNRVIADLRKWVLQNRFQGINVDFENLPDADYALYVPFLQRMKTAFAPNHLLVTVDLEANKPLNWRAVSSICDFVVVMAYDEHGSVGPAGPIASMKWYRETLPTRSATSPATSSLSVSATTRTTGWKAASGRSR